jgi:uncharacterized protein
MSRLGSPDSTAPVINAREFARGGETLAGNVPIAALARLAASLSGRDGEIRYRLQGATDKYGKATLELEFDTCVRLVCQRCLQQFELPLAGRNRLRLIDAEPAWSAEQAEVAADDDDEIVASAAFDVRALIEDEVLLALPLAPRHGECEVTGGRIEVRRESPFGVLAQLKKRAAGGTSD